MRIITAAAKMKYAYEELTSLVMAIYHMCKLLSNKSTAARGVPLLILGTSVLVFDHLLISNHHDLITSRFVQ